MPHKDADARRAYQQAYRLFHPSADDDRRAYQRLYYSVHRDKMLARAAARRAAKRADVPPITIGQDVFLTAYRQCRPNDPHRAAHAVWRALATTVASTQKDTP